MPKIVKKNVKRVAAPSRRGTKSGGGNGKKLLFLLVGLVVVIALAFAFKPWRVVQKQITLMTEGAPMTMPKPASGITKNFTLEPNASRIVFLKAENGAVITLAFPAGVVDHKRTISVATTKDETGVIMSPQGTKFLRPVSITFDLSKTQLKNDAPDKVDQDHPRTSGKTHLYMVDAKNHVSPILIARGMETSVLVSGRTLFAGAYVLRTDGKSAVKYAKATLDDANSYFYSNLEAAATLMGNKQTLTATEQANAKNAVARVMSKKSAPLYETYAAVIVNNYLSGKQVSLIPRAYADDGLEAQLRQTCSEDTHATETYINAELLATMQGFTTVAPLCRQTGDKVLRANAQALFNNSNATFEETMVMIGQVKSIEGTTSVLLTNMENKLKEVVYRDAKNALNNPTESLQDLQAVIEHEDYTVVDPKLSKELTRVTFMDARKAIEKLLAKPCAQGNEILYAKSLVIEYTLDDLKYKVAALNECDVTGLSAPASKNIPPPGTGGGSAGQNASVPQTVGTCFAPFEYSYNIHDDGMCEVCYDVVTENASMETLYTQCKTFACGNDYLDQDVENRTCSQYKVNPYSDKITDPAWQPLNDNPPIPDTLDDSTNNPGDPQIPDSLGNDNNTSDPAIPDSLGNTNNNTNDPAIPDSLDGSGNQQNDTSNDTSGN